MTITLPGGASSYSESGIYTSYIGSYSSVKAFYYYLVITDDSTSQSSLIDLGTSTNCLTTACVGVSGTTVTSCSPAVVDPYLGTGCISGDLSWNDKSDGTPCPHDFNPCIGQIDIVCSCSTGSCVYDSSSTSIVCWCQTGAVATSTSCSCGGEFYVTGGNCCDISCATCADGSLLCLTCVAANTYLDSTQGCDCNAGYYGTKPLASAGACTACYQECATCSQANLCLTCISGFSTVDATQGCNCNTGYYGVRPLAESDSCVACYSACATCTEASVCSSCVSSNASPDLSLGCNCNSGFYGTNPLVTSNACSACYSACATCNQADICLTCVSSHASPDPIQGCNCNAGYYGTKPLLSATSCTACYMECSSCTQASLCSSCIATNSLPSLTLGCSCNSGYWGTPSLTTSTSCTLCYEECTACSQANACTSCISSNSLPNTLTNIGCVCNSGYWGNAPLTSLASCVPCGTECATCTQANLCTSCLDPHASPASTQGCACTPGYWVLAPLSASNPCTPCSPDCATCNNSYSCLSCISQNASPNSSTGTGCTCDAGFYSISPTKTNCEKCPADCKTCKDPLNCLSCIVSNSNPVTGGLCQCPHNALIVNYSCNCVGGYIMNYDAGENLYSCSTCDLSCRTCFGTSPTQCIECAPGVGYNSTTHLCEVCTQGQYFGNNACNQCNSECATCDNYIQCLSCYDTRKQLNATGHCNLVCRENQVLVGDVCYNCTSLCERCGDRKACVNCVENASASNGECTCNIGYGIYNNTCAPRYFDAVLTVNLVAGYNKILISFTEAPEFPLGFSDFNISVGENSASGIEFYVKDIQDYSFRLAFYEEILGGTQVIVTILASPLYSSSNSQLSNYLLEGQLYSFSPNKMNPSVQGMAKSAAAISQVAVTTSIGAAIVSNPAAAWALINSIQIVAYLPISSNPLTPGIQAFCTGIGAYNLMPNLMAYIFKVNDTSPPYLEAGNYGINTSVFWINMGPNITAFLGCLVVMPVVYLLSKIKIAKIAMRFGDILKNYKFGFFLRFWIQCYLDIGFFAIIQLKAVIFK